MESIRILEEINYGLLPSEPSTNQRLYPLVLDCSLPSAFTQTYMIAKSLISVASAIAQEELCRLRGHDRDSVQSLPSMYMYKKSGEHRKRQMTLICYPQLLLLSLHATLGDSHIYHSKDSLILADTV
jgi:hypothetical protein